MFSQACYIPSVGGGEKGHAWQERGHDTWQRRDVCGEGGGHAWWWGACVAAGVHGRGMHGGGGHVWQEGGGMHGRRHGHCSGRYASYWNAFLYIRFKITP